MVGHRSKAKLLVKSPKLRDHLVSQGGWPESEQQVTKQANSSLPSMGGKPQTGDELLGHCRTCPPWPEVHAASSRNRTGREATKALCTNPPLKRATKASCMRASMIGSTPDTPNMPGQTEALLPSVKAKPGLTILASGERAASGPATTSPTAMSRSDHGG